MRLLTFSKYDPEYAKAYREKQRAKREAANKAGVVTPPPKPATKPPRTTQPVAVKTPQQAVVTLDRGEELPAACACAMPQPTADDIKWMDVNDYRSAIAGNNVRFTLAEGTHLMTDADLTSVGLKDPEMRKRVLKINKLFAERYGHGLPAVENVKFIEQYGRDTSGTIAYIRNDRFLGLNPKKISNMQLEYNEKIGWFAPGTGNIEGVLVHEYGHALLQSTYGRLYYTGAAAQRISLNATRAARDAGMPPGVPGLSVSKYSHTDRYEAEAELFAFYHMGGAKRPNWVIKWGETLHHEMGLDPTPICVDLGLCKELGAVRHPPKTEERKKEPTPVGSKLTDAQFAALLPKRGGWTTTTRNQTIAALKQSPEGRQLLKTIDSFQSGSAVNIPRLRTDIEKVLAGDTSLPEGRVAAVRNILDALAHSDAGDRSLYRGFIGTGNLETVLAQYKAGNPLNLSLASFSTDKKLAAEFGIKGAGKRVAAKTTTPILVEWVSGRRRALPIENLAKSRVFANEREWVGAGRYKIVNVTTRTISGHKYVVLRVEQESTW